MLKSKPQSKQASYCTTISMKYFTLLQHQSIYFNTNSPNNFINEAREYYSTRTNSSEQEMHEKQELKALQQLDNK